VVALDPESLAVARTMITATKHYGKEARALLDLGATRSSLIIYDNNSVQFSITLPYSGELITTAISQQLHIPYEEAEQKKVQCGLKFTKKKADQPIWNILTTQANTLAKEIEKAIMFYYSHFPHANSITHITMCGGGSRMDRLPEMLSVKLKIECKPGHPWKNLNLSKKHLREAPDGLSYATAIGLALRAADNPFLASDIV
jgi:type IV pilus assembly protein PilM